MANSDEKVSKFVEAITAYAEEQRQKIHQEVEDFKTERLRQAEQQVLQDSYQLIQKERAEVNNAFSRETSQRDLEARQQLLGKRRDMMEAVFAEAREKLGAYTKTPAYREALAASLRAMQTELPAEGTVYFISPADADKRAALEALLPAGSRLETAVDIQLGGLRGENLGYGRLLDDTLDTRLELQREWFTKYSGLTVE